MNGERVGTWTWLRGTHRFNYHPEWQHSPRYRPLSLSMPWTGNTLQGDQVGWFFDNLLPDNPDVRRRIQARFSTRRDDPFSLLEAIGRDCVGAVQLLPGDDEPEGWNHLRAEPLSSSDVARRLRNRISALPGDPLGEGDLRISLAGAQEKTALLRIGEQWLLPEGATPTSHILKLPLTGMLGGQVDLHHTVENEWLCLRILAAMGLPAARTQVEHYEGQEVLVVERFDRQWADSGTQEHHETSDLADTNTANRYLLRIPQEDLCQALSEPPARKYQADGGPDPDRIQTLLAQSSNDLDQATFALALFAFWLLAAPDGHAKNFSIFIQRNGNFTMTPLYDVLSMHPYLGSAAGQVHPRKLKLAMRLPKAAGGGYAMQSMQPRHWHRFALATGGAQLWQHMKGMAASIDAMLQTVEPDLPPDFPPQVWSAISAGLRTQAATFLQSAPP